MHALQRLGFWDRVLPWRRRRLARVLEADMARRLIAGVESKSVRPQDLIFAGRTTSAIWSNFTTRFQVERGMTASAWVYSAVTATSTAIASVPWFVETQQRDGTWERDTEHPLNRLLSDPNPSRFQDFQFIKELAMSHLLLTGNAVLTKERDGLGVPREIWVHDPGGITPYLTHDDLFIESYEIVSRHGRRANCPAEDVIHVMLPNPMDQTWGLSPLTVLAKAIDVDADTKEWQKNLLQNMAVPPLILSPGSGTGGRNRHTTKAQNDRADDYYVEQNAGPKNARKAIILAPDTKVTLGSFSPQELDYLNSREFNAEEIAAVYRVPPPLLGLLRRATYANAETFRLTWWENTLIPQDKRLRRAFDLQLASDFGPGVRFGSDLSRVPALLERAKQRAELFKLYVDIGYPINVVNEHLGVGMPRIEGGDVGRVNSNLLPIRGVSEDQFAREVADSAKLHLVS